MRHDIGQRRGSHAIRNRDPDDLAPGVGKLGNLPEGRLRVTSVGRGHRLDNNRRASTDLDIPNVNRTGLSTRSDHLPRTSSSSRNFYPRLPGTRSPLPELGEGRGVRTDLPGQRTSRQLIYTTWLGQERLTAG